MNNAQLVIDEVKKAVKGKDDCIIKAFAAFLAGGHILLEDASASTAVSTTAALCSWWSPRSGSSSAS